MALKTLEAELHELAAQPALSYSGKLYAAAVEAKLVDRKRNLLGMWSYTITDAGRAALTGTPA